MTAYYNEVDPFAAAWLGNLISAGLIAPGVVDERSIVDVRAADLVGFSQCHFFAGIGGWSRALRLAGWADDRPVWTGSCPCQPFSVAGKGKGSDDERHLWPVWFDLIRECRPSAVFGEQVAAAVGHSWLDAVSRDMEGEGYAIGSAVLGAHSVGSPHIRQRLWFVADAYGWHARAEGVQRGGEQRQQPQDGGSGLLADAQRSERGSFGVSKFREADGAQGQGQAAELAGNGDGGGMADAGSKRRDGQYLLRKEGSGVFEAAGGCEAGLLADAMPAGRAEWRAEPGDGSPAGLRGSGGVADASGSGRQQFEILAGSDGARGGEREEGVELGDDGVHSDDARRPGPLHGFWRDADWLHCRDGKWRPVRPGTFPLAARIPNRVGRLRAYGNAIVPQVAAEFIGAYLDAVMDCAYGVQLSTGGDDQCLNDLT